MASVFQASERRDAQRRMRKTISRVDREKLRYELYWKFWGLKGLCDKNSSSIIVHIFGRYQMSSNNNLQDEPFNLPTYLDLLITSLEVL